MRPALTTAINRVADERSSTGSRDIETGIALPPKRARPAHGERGQRAAVSRTTAAPHGQGARRKGTRDLH